jgi:predicted GNAT family acetyltransferase
MNQEIIVTNNKELMRFEVELNGESGYINYRGYKEDIAFMNAIVPETFRGKGIGSKMARAALEYANSENLKVLLYCPFVSKFVKDHEEYHHLVDVKYHPTFKK